MLDVILILGTLALVLATVGLAGLMGRLGGK